MAEINIRPGGFDHPQVQALLELHVHRSRQESAPGSAHALGLSALKAPDVTFWSAWSGTDIAGFGALKWLSDDHGEVKSMHTVQNMRRRGVGKLLLKKIIKEAHTQGLKRISLETGSWPYFAPARKLYTRFGFQECPPFGNYQLDENSVFMTLDFTQF